MLNNRSRGIGDANDTRDGSGGTIGEVFSMAKRRQWSNPTRPTKRESPPNISVAIHTETTIHLERSSQWMGSSRESVPKQESVVSEIV